MSLPPTQVHLLPQHAHWFLLICYTTVGDEPKSKCVLIKVPSVISNQKREMKIMQKHGLELKVESTVEPPNKRLSLSLSLTLILPTYPSFPTLLLLSLPHTFLRPDGLSSLLPCVHFIPLCTLSLADLESKWPNEAALQLPNLHIIVSK